MAAAGKSCVAVFGASTPSPGDEQYEFARRTGELLARRGYCVVNGGYGGTMEASARGARQAGGTTIGVTCGLWSSRPNDYLDETRPTGDLQERLTTLVELATAGCVALRGGTGTLLELAMVWELKAKGFLAEKPIVCVEDFWRPVVEPMGLVRPDCLRHVTLAAGPEDIAATFPDLTD